MVVYCSSCIYAGPHTQAGLCGHRGPRGPHTQSLCGPGHSDVQKNTGFPQVVGASEANTNHFGMQTQRNSNCGRTEPHFAHLSISRSLSLYIYIASPSKRVHTEPRHPSPADPPDPLCGSRTEMGPRPAAPVGPTHTQGSPRCGGHRMMAVTQTPSEYWEA